MGGAFWRALGSKAVEGCVENRAKTFVLVRHGWPQHYFCIDVLTCPNSIVICSVLDRQSRDVTVSLGRRGSGRESRVSRRASTPPNVMLPAFPELHERPIPSAFQSP
jgi:hypothetical protein